jgi:ATP-dependent Lon protease
MKDIKEIINEEIVKEDKKNITLPAIAMRGLVTFPKMIMHFDVSRVMSVKAIEMALKADRKIFIVTQKDVHLENPQEKDLYKIGVIAEVRQTLKTPDNVLRVLIEGVQRAKINSIVNDSDYLIADVKEIPNYSKSKVENVELEAMVRTIKDEFELYCSYNASIFSNSTFSLDQSNEPYLSVPLNNMCSK